ncbi:regulatory LuxR family protein [Brockia lithotrophica]|uniref:Regulatory LuxR family protein n=1 Tax=Brockia lithotrophica TaxID=933949 RepID=A0A660L3E6_9BACL|nr:regulatory LuxR family protein [Brockia lithotrophica]
MESPPEKRIPDQEPAFLAADEEIAEVLGDLRRRNIRPHCGSRYDRSLNVPVLNSGRLFSFVACLRRRYRRYETLGMYLPDVGLIVTDSDLRVALVMHPAPRGSGGEQGGESALSSSLSAIPEFKPGDLLDEASYGLTAFVLAKRSGRIRAVAGAVHTCPQFKGMWTVAVPFGKEPLGYVGLFLSTDRDLHGYALWLIEVTEQIGRELWVRGGEAERRTLSESGEEGETAGFLENTLTEREREVLDLMLEGLSDEAIGQKLYISVWTVRTHRKNMYRKLGVSTLRELVGKMKGWVLAKKNASFEV